MLVLCTVVTTLLDGLSFSLDVDDFAAAIFGSFAIVVLMVFFGLASGIVDDVCDATMALEPDLVLILTEGRSVELFDGLFAAFF